MSVVTLGTRRCNMLNNIYIFNCRSNIPDNIRLLSLPPYSPELNPVEHIWDDLREKAFHNLVFDSLDALEDHLEAALRDMENDQNRIHSIVAWPWIINALLN